MRNNENDTYDCLGLASESYPSDRRGIETTPLNSRFTSGDRMVPASAAPPLLFKLDGWEASVPISPFAPSRPILANVILY